MGRPPTGAVNLNIVRTGRGVGRPKKDSLKKRGRPAANPSGRPRGRPKKNNLKPVADDVEEEEVVEDEDQPLEHSENDEVPEAEVPTPKKRGRPSLGKSKSAASPTLTSSPKKTPSGKPRGRPAKAKQQEPEEDDDDDEDEKTTTVKSPSRGRPKSVKSLDLTGGEDSLSGDVDDGDSNAGDDKSEKRISISHSPENGAKKSDGETNEDFAECASDEATWVA